MKTIKNIFWLAVIAVLLILRFTDPVLPHRQEEQYVYYERSQPAQQPIKEYTSTLKEISRKISENLENRQNITEYTETVKSEETEEEAPAEPAAAEPEVTAVEYPAYYGGSGTVKSIDGTTVVISIFASDPDCGWDWDNPDDIDTYSNAYYSLLEAGEWLEKEAGSWGADTNIICDWMEYNGLYHEAYFDERMITEESSTYNPMSDYVNNYINSEEIMERYNADSIAYIFYFNGKHTDEVWAYAYPLFGNVFKNDFSNEMILLNCGHPTFIMKAATIAHELLHTFGLPDMYYANNRITQEYVDYLNNSGSDEIMFGHADWDYYDIQPHFTELDAYYLGLCDYSEDVNRWNLDTSVYCR